MKIKLTGFQGIVPVAEPRALDDVQAQTARNVDLLRGVLTSINAPGNVSVLPDASRISMFPYNGSWLSWATDVNVVRGPINGDLYNRIYYTGSGAPKIRGVDNGVEQEWTLGIPKPATLPVCTTQAKSETTWTRTWHYQYESSDGTITQSGDLTEGDYGGEVVNCVTPGSSYQIETLPAKTTAGTSDKFVAYFDAYSADGSYLGRLYPASSALVNNSDFYLDGASVTATEVNATPSPQCTFTLAYDTSRASDYNVDRYYSYTFVSAWGEEGPPSISSAVTTVSPIQDCMLTGFDALGYTSYDASALYRIGQVMTLDGHYYMANQDIDDVEPFTATHWDDLGTTNPFNISKVRIYRTVTGDAGTFFKYVDEIAFGETEYLDQKTDADTENEIESTNWYPPPGGLQGLVELPNGGMAGFLGRTIYFCEPYRPHAYPRSYAQTVHFDIVGLGVNASGLVVLTKGNPYLLMGTHPSQMIQERIDSTQSCVSKRSIVSMGDTNSAIVIYASPDGLTAISGGVARVISAKYWNRAQWQALNPSTMLAAITEGRYFAVTSATTFIFDFDEQRSALTTTDETATGLYSDLETDLLYMIQGANLNTWDTGVAKKTLVWKGKQFVFDRRGSFNVVRVRAQTYPVTIRLYSAGSPTPVTSISILNDVARRVPMLRDNTIWEFQVEATSDVYEILLSSSMGEL